MSIKLEEGKRYISKSGDVITIAGTSDPDNLKFPVTGSVAGTVAGQLYRWKSDGRFYENSQHPFDLIAEYHEPAPAGWILCKDRMPTEADGRPFPGLNPKELYVAVPSNEEPWWKPVVWNASGLILFPRSWDAWLPFPDIPKFTPPAPEKKKVPLGLEDVPPGSVLRFREDPDDGWVMVINVMRKGVICFLDSGEQVNFRWDVLLRDHEISRDGGKTWEPCWKEEA